MLDILMFQKYHLRYIYILDICQKYLRNIISGIYQIYFQKYYPRCRFSLLTTASPLGPLTLGHLRRSNFLSNIFPTKKTFRFPTKKTFRIRFSIVFLNCKKQPVFPSHLRLSNYYFSSLKTCWLVQHIFYSLCLTKINMIVETKIKLFFQLNK